MDIIAVFSRGAGEHGGPISSQRQHVGKLPTGKWAAALSKSDWEVLICWEVAEAGRPGERNES